MKVGRTRYLASDGAERMITRDATVAVHKTMFMFDSSQSCRMLVFREPAGGSDVLEMPSLMLRFSAARPVQLTRTEKGFERLRFDSDAIADPKNAGGGNQPRSHPGVDCVDAKAILRSKFRNFQVHTRPPQSHQITPRRRTPEKQFRFVSFCFALLRITSRLLLAGRMPARIRRLSDDFGPSRRPREPCRS